MYNKITIFFTLALVFSCGNPSSQLKLFPEVYDYGELEKDSLFRGSAIIKNAGKSILIIENVSPDCGCTRVILSKMAINPKDTCLMQFSYNTFNKKGQQENFILLTANTDSIVHALQINAFVK